jgi:4-alpha-glucanotransferase
MYYIVRIDHFRGFDRFYAVPTGSENARNGCWREGPKEALFADKKDWRIVAEDLGVLDEGVYRLMENTGYPRMKILEFAFDGNPDHEFKPSNYDDNCVVYTGTHDNATFIEHLEGQTPQQLEVFYTDLAAECKKWNVEFTFQPEEIADAALMHRARKAVMQAAYLSYAQYVIFPLQDLLGAGADARMNCPGILSAYNWSWRYQENVLTDDFAEEIRKATVAGKR